MIKIKANRDRFKEASSDSSSKKLGYLYGTIITLCSKTDDKRAIIYCVESALDTLDPNDKFENSVINMLRTAVKDHGIEIE